MRRVLSLTVIVFLSGIFGNAAFANEFEPVRDKEEFLSLLEDRELRIGLYNLKLRVLPDGKIVGSALGWEVTGKWAWNNGYFCRDMDWSGYPIAYNCQLVEKRGDGELRFTSDQGAGQRASFRLR
jgi:hypothetical protein